MTAMAYGAAGAADVAYVAAGRKLAVRTAIATALLREKRHSLHVLILLETPNAPGHTHCYRSVLRATW